MKKSLAMIFCFLLLFSACAASAANVKVRYQVEYKPALARSMLSIINENRTKDKVWQWKSDNKTKEYFSGLKPLQYDYNLETIAMRRAAEIAIYYSHTRPDGSSCFTCFPTSSMSYYYGENIAYSWASYGASACSTADGTFWLWWEEDEPYEYQGHRRNMLDKSFRYIGIGCVYVNNAYYWTQAFSLNPIAASDALPMPTTVEASLYSGVNGNIGPLKAEPESITLGIDESASVPTVTFDGVHNSFLTDVTVVDPQFTASSGIISISDGKLTGKEAGETAIKATVGSRTVSVPVKVAGACEHTNTEEVILKEATCTQPGQKQIVCKDCGEALSKQEIPAKGHTAVKDDAVAPTCTGTGLTEGSHCSVCSEVIEAQKEVPATGHTPGSWVTVSEPTATKAGLKELRCKVCEELIDSEEIPPVVSSKKAGDINGDGIVNGKDSILLLQYLAGWDVSFNSENADINGDGTVNGKDSMLLLQYLAGWESAYIK